MAQHDMVIDNGPGLAVRTDINAALQALVQQNSGPVEPTTKYPGMLWLDTTVSPDGMLRQRNQANTAWITVTSGMLVDAPTDGNTYARKNGAWLGGVITSIVTTALTSSSTYTKPANLKFLEVIVVGAGGAGGAAVANGAGAYSVGGSGGGGGFGTTMWPASAVPASFAYTIGAAGAGGTSTGAAGGNTTANGLTAGGGGGGNVTQTGSGIAAGVGGAGGAATGAAVNVPGDAGGSSYTNIGLANLHYRGAVPGGRHGTGSPAAFASGTSSGQAVTPAGGYGAAGAGSTAGPSTAVQGGGSGTQGLIILKEYF